MENNSGSLGATTRAEIMQQPELWPTTLEIVSRHGPVLTQQSGSTLISGAGTSAYAASAIAESWLGAAAIPTTDLLLSDSEHLGEVSRLLSIARSGDSPESVATVRHMQRLYPKAQQLAITCNAMGALAQMEEVDAIVLDPRTNDRSLVMTSSFSNLTLAGLCLHHLPQLQAEVTQISRHVESQLDGFSQRAREIAQRGVTRMMVLGSGPLFPMAREAALKVLEITAGHCVALAETFLGLRHGPMSFLSHDTLVLCFLSSETRRRRYEEDLIAELHRKQLGKLLVIAPASFHNASDAELVPANAPNLPDALRTPFEIVFPQLLAYHLSLKAGLNPDNPSPTGVITRVVQGVQIHAS